MTTRKKAWPWLIGLAVSIAAFAVWIPGLADTGLTLYSWFPLFGLLAWSLMWTHYINGIMVLRYGFSRSVTYKRVSQIIVFFCLWLHPGLLILQRWVDTGNLPPQSLSGYLGQSKLILIVAAFAAWLAFLSYDVLVRYKNRPFWQRNWWWVSLAQAGAMGVIYIHAISFGRHIQVAWFKLYWAVLGLILLPIMVYLLWVELPESSKLKERIRTSMKNTKLLVAAGIVGLIIVAIGGYVLINDKKDEAQQSAAAPTTSQQATSSGSTITLAQVQENNGKNGKKCWVIVDTTVYEISGFAQWVDGVHTSSGGQARCGKDLTSVMADAPHGRSVLKLLTVVGSYNPQ